MTQAGRSPVQSDPTYPGAGEVLHVRKLLTRYAAQRRIRAVKNLLTGKAEGESAEVQAAQEEEEEKEETVEERKARPIVSFYHPNVTLELVADAGMLDLQKTPAPVRNRECRVLTPPQWSAPLTAIRPQTSTSLVKEPSPLTTSRPTSRSSSPTTSGSCTRT